MTETNLNSTTKPVYVTDLEKAYGEPSQAAFGSAVFYEKLKPDAYLEKEALAKYRYFVGQQWDRLGGDKAWLGPWKKVFSRKDSASPGGSPSGIVAELQNIDDQDAAISAPMILDVVEDAQAAKKALAAAYDAPQVTELNVYNIGDGAAMSGLVLAGRRKNGEATFLVFLMD